MTRVGSGGIGRATSGGSLTYHYIPDAPNSPWSLKMRVQTPPYEGPTPAHMRVQERLGWGIVFQLQSPLTENKYTSNSRPSQVVPPNAQVIAQLFTILPCT